MAATMSLAGRLRRRKDVRITLVNGSDRFTERLRLHQLASGQELADLRIPAMLAGTGVTLETGWVTNIDADARQIRVDDERVLPYDTLVYALGGTADTGAVPGADEHAYTLDSAEHADALARRLPDLESIAICGTGFTGVEAAAEIAERHPHLRVVLIGRSEPGATMTPKAKAYLDAALRRLTVEVRTGVEIVKILPGGVALAGGETVDVEAVLWTGGVRVSPLAAAAGFEVDRHGRIVTDAALRSVSHPSVYAIGDAAAVRQGYGTMHGTCQGGIPTGVHAAASIARELAGAAQSVAADRHVDVHLRDHPAADVEAGADGHGRLGDIAHARGHQSVVGDERRRWQRPWPARRERDAPLRKSGKFRDLLREHIEGDRRARDVIGIDAETAGEGVGHVEIDAGHVAGQL
jgi:NADH dehydrogenase FAD-containing subunit